MIRVDYEPGCPVETDPKGKPEQIEASIRAATDLAAKADVAVVFAGLTWHQESEGFDRRDINMPLAQVALIESVTKVNSKTIVVLNNGSVLEMKSWIGHVGTVVEAWFTGQECGNAIASVLFGDVNPSGKIAETFPVKYEDTPAYINYPGENGQVVYGEGIFVGYRYYDKKQIEPLFPFGYGLSYTTFDYGNMKINSAQSSTGALFEVSAEIRNTGKRPGKEIAQLYICDPISSLVRPVKELKGFQKVDLNAGQTKNIRFTLKPRDFAFFDPRRNAWIVEAGNYEIFLASSSRDIRLRGTLKVETELVLK